MLGTVHEIIDVDDTTRVVVYYDDDYQIEAEERDLTPEEVTAELDYIEQEGVYGVGVEKLRTWYRENEEGVIVAQRTEWDGVDAIWGCFLNETYTALEVAREHFPEHFTL